jgi:23S rRNA pseudouridine2605 synthase
MSEKVHKALARAGYGSRRGIEAWIRDGRVTINGRPAKVGDRVVETDRIAVDGKQINLASPAFQRRVLAYHKTEGEICTASDPQGRPTILERFPQLTGERWITVGRLDLNTTGLILATNDGELAHRLMHPSAEVEREYAVRVLGKVTPPMLRRLTTGVTLDDGRAVFEAVFDAGGRGANHWYHVVLKEGRNRIVRRLWESQGVKVSRLIRVRYGPIALPSSLKAGCWKELEARDTRLLERAVGLSSDRPEPDKRQRRARRQAPRIR